MLTSAAVRKQGRLVNEPCWVTVFPGRPRIQRIEVCIDRCGLKRVDLRVLGLPEMPRRPAVEVRLELLQLPSALVTPQVQGRFRDDKLVAGNVDQLIALIPKLSHESYHGPIVALGTKLICRHGEHWVPFLSMIEKDWMLQFTTRFQRWNQCVRFIAYREGNGYGEWPPGL